VGGDPFAIGAILYIDVFAATILEGRDFPSDAFGSASVDVPIPAVPALAGTIVTFQSVSAWSVACGLGPFNLSSSIAAVAVIQP
jgi:hypothetical protein